MDVLNSLFAKAELEGLLRPLHSTGQRLSLYADDVALFIRPDHDDLQITKSLLQIFCDASSLQTNLQKSQWRMHVGRQGGDETIEMLICVKI